MEILLYTTPLGLLLDIVGFLLVIRYGHSLFRWVGTDYPDDRTISAMPPGSEFIVREGPSDTGENRRMRLRAHIGVATVVAGFSLQIVGSTAAIFCG